MRTHTHTVATLEVSIRTYEEIKGLLQEAGYAHAFIDDEVIDMTGIGLAPVRIDVGDRTHCPEHGETCSGSDCCCSDLHE